MEKSEKDLRKYLNTLFDGYKARKKRNQLYKQKDIIPKIIISEYLEFVEKPSFKNLITSYKKKYILYESKVESNSSKNEKLGLADVYDYIQNFDFDNDKFNVFICSLFIHKKLYSHFGDGNFGGNLRESTAVLQDLNIELKSPEETMIIFNSYIPKGNYIAEKLKEGDIFGYIEDCVKLNVELIKLQPFADGNKRTFRALLNLLFKRLNIPPVYIEEYEIEEYKKVLIKAMQATSEKDFDDIIQFYYYKICDSIINLDIKNSELFDLKEQQKKSR